MVRNIIMMLSVSLPLMITSAEAQDNNIFTAALDGLNGVIEDYPKPWPLNNLVKPGVLTVAMSGDNPPADFVDKSTGNLTGFVHELYLQLGTDLGLEVEFVRISFSGQLPGLKANRFDMACSGAGWTTQRLGSQDFFLTSPIAINGSLGLTRKDTGIAGWDDVEGKRLVGASGEISLEHGKSLPIGSVIEVPGQPEALLALVNRQADFIVNNIGSILFMQKNAPNKDDLVVFGPLMKPYAQGLCVNPAEPDLLQAVNVLLGNYRARGYLRELYEKYDAPVEVVDLLKTFGY